MLFFKRFFISFLTFSSILCFSVSARPVRYKLSTEERARVYQLIGEYAQHSAPAAESAQLRTVAWNNLKEMLKTNIDRRKEGESLPVLGFTIEKFDSLDDDERVKVLQQFGIELSVTQAVGQVLHQRFARQGIVGSATFNTSVYLQHCKKVDFERLISGESGLWGVLTGVIQSLMPQSADGAQGQETALFSLVQNVIQAMMEKRGKPLEAVGKGLLASSGAVESLLQGIESDPDFKLLLLDAIEQAYTGISAIARGIPGGSAVGEQLNPVGIVRFLLDKKMLSNHFPRLVQGGSWKAGQKLASLLLGDSGSYLYSGLLGKVESSLPSLAEDERLSVASIVDYVDEIKQMYGTKFVVELARDYDELVDPDNGYLAPIAAVIPQLLLKDNKKKLELLAEVMQLRDSALEEEVDRQRIVQVYRKLRTLIIQQRNYVDEKFIQQQEELGKAQKELWEAIVGNPHIALPGTIEEVAPLLGVWNPLDGRTADQIIEGIAKVHAAYDASITNDDLQKLVELQRTINEWEVKLTEEAGSDSWKRDSNSSNTKKKSWADQRIDFDKKLAQMNGQKMSLLQARSLAEFGNQLILDVKKRLRVHQGINYDSDDEVYQASAAIGESKKGKNPASSDSEDIRDRFDFYAEPGILGNGVNNICETVNSHVTRGLENGTEHLWCNATDQETYVKELIQLTGRSDLRSEFEKFDAQDREIQKENDQFRREYNARPSEMKLISIQQKKDLVHDFIERRVTTHEEYMATVTPLVSWKIPLIADHFKRTGQDGKEVYSFAPPADWIPVPTHIGLYGSDITKFAFMGAQSYVDYRFYKRLSQDRAQDFKEKMIEDLEQMLKLTDSKNFDDDDNGSTAMPMNEKQREEKKKQQQIHRNKKLKKYLESTHTYLGFNVFKNPSGKAIGSYMVLEAILSACKNGMVRPEYEALWDNGVKSAMDFEYGTQNWHASMGLTKEEAAAYWNSFRTVSLTTLLEPILRPQAGSINIVLRLFHAVSRALNSLGGPSNWRPEVYESKIFDVTVHIIGFLMTLKFLDSYYNEAWVSYVLKHKKLLHLLLSDYNEAKQDFEKIKQGHVLSTHSVHDVMKRMKLAEAKLMLFVEQGHKDLSTQTVLSKLVGGSFWSHLKALTTSSAKSAAILSIVLAIPVFYNGYPTLKQGYDFFKEYYFG